MSDEAEAARERRLFNNEDYSDDLNILGLGLGSQ
jgi:hypothetical protein